MNRSDLQRLWHRLTAPQARADDAARREYMTKVILVILNAIGVILFIGFGIGVGVGALTPDFFVIGAVVEVFLLGGWWLADRGYWQPISYIPPIMFFLLALLSNYDNGAGTIAMLQYALVVLLAAMLQGGITQWGALLLCIGAYLYIGWLDTQGLLPPALAPRDKFAAFAVPVAGMLTFITMLQWFYAVQFRRTIAEARTYAAERAQAEEALKEYRDHLEILVKERTAELTVVNEQLQQEMTERERLQQQVLDAQQQVIRELSTPIIPVMHRIIVMPLIGIIDTLRARDITRALLVGISAYRAKVVILDITGVPVVDSGVAAHLDKTIQAARLKGARVIVTGISDAVAETIVDLGLDWRRIETRRDLQTGLLVALKSMGIKLST